MMMNRFVGSANDGYIDNIAVKLVADGSAASLPYIRMTNSEAESSGINGMDAENGTVGKVNDLPCNFSRVSGRPPGMRTVSSSRLISLQTAFRKSITAPGDLRSAGLRPQSQVFGCSCRGDLSGCIGAVLTTAPKYGWSDRTGRVGSSACRPTTFQLAPVKSRFA